MTLSQDEVGTHSPVCLIHTHIVGDRAGDHVVSQTHGDFCKKVDQNERKETKASFHQNMWTNVF